MVVNDGDFTLVESVKDHHSHGSVIFVRIHPWPGLASSSQSSKGSPQKGARSEPEKPAELPLMFIKALIRETNG